MMSAESTSTTITDENPRPLLKAQGLNKIYPQGNVRALSDLAITIYEGEIFGLLGPNGAGKTTAISILSTILKPTAGQVSIDDIDVLGSAHEVRKIIGLVPQDIAVYTPLTARENLVYFGRLHGLRGDDLKKRIERSLQIVGLSDQADKRVHTYSGGMKRRLNLAVGVVHRPRVLFLDEPTVGIDAQSRNLILEQLAQLKKSGTTMVYTTHYMEEAESICDRVAIIDQGRVIALGTPAELVKQADGCHNLEDLFLKLTGKHLRD